MKKLALTSKLSYLVACIALACCRTDESVEMAVNKADAETDLVLGKWSMSPGRFYFMNFNGEMELKDVLFGWSGWPEQEADALIESLESRLRPAFTGYIIFKSDQTYSSSSSILPSFGKWNLSGNSLTLDSGGSKTFLTVELISSSTLEVTHYHSILTNVELDGLDSPEEISVMVATRVTLTK